jgi:hypothetical protein
MKIKCYPFSQQEFNKATVYELSELSTIGAPFCLDVQKETSEHLKTAPEGC